MGSDCFRKSTLCRKNCREFSIGCLVVLWVLCDRCLPCCDRLFEPPLTFENGPQRRARPGIVMSGFDYSLKIDDRLREIIALEGCDRPSTLTARVDFDSEGLDRFFTKQNKLQVVR